MKERFRRRRLPHWDVPSATYFITSCLAGSIPAQGLLKVRQKQVELIASRPHDQSPNWKSYVWKKTFVEQEHWLDNEPAAKHLANPALAQIVMDSLKHFHQIRYELIAFVVMPSHFHWLFRSLPEWEATLAEGKSAREVVMHSIKSFTAHECRKIVKTIGPFWQDESFDHCVYDEAEMERILDYIELNPVKAGLCRRREEWRYSSAFGRSY